MPLPPEHKIKVSRLIEKVLWENEGITPDRLHDMLARAARITHEKGNRRYHEYLFNVEGNVLYSVHKMRTVADELITLERPSNGVVEVQEDGHTVRVRKPVNISELRPKNRSPVLLQRSTSAPAGTVACEHCDAMGQISVADECENCHGDSKGCDFCDDGLVSNVISCPVCKGAKFVKPRR